MNRYLLSSALVLSLFAACNSSSDTDPGSVAEAGSDDGGTAGESAAAGGSTSGKTSSGGDAGSPDSVGGMVTAGGGGAGMSGTNPGAAGDMSVAGSGSGDGAPACEIPETVVGSCAKKDLNGVIKSCAVYWGSAFTADALKAACPSEPTLGSNICPSEGSVGACETSSGPTALANYYYNAADGSPANQAQCNANIGHVWCSP